jgi:cyclic patellamide precursor peptide PatG
MSDTGTFSDPATDLTAPSPQPMQRASAPCSACGMTAGHPGEPERSTGAQPTRRYVYTLGRVEARYPSLSVEKEFAQAAGRAETIGLTDPEVLAKLLSAKQNRYLARSVCWILTIEGIEAYVLMPRDSDDLDMLIESLRPAPRITDLNVVIGRIGPMAAPSLCNGLTLPTVTFDQVFSFDLDSFANAVPVPEGSKEKDFKSSVLSVFLRVLQMADNRGVDDHHRALNYLATRYPAIYHATADRHAQDSSLDGVEVRPSRLARPRAIVDVIFSFRSRKTDVVEKLFARVDVSEEFPFLVTKLSPFYDR